MPDGPTPWDSLSTQGREAESSSHACEMATRVVVLMGCEKVRQRRQTLGSVCFAAPAELVLGIERSMCGTVAEETPGGVCVYVCMCV